MEMPNHRLSLLAVHKKHVAQYQESDHLLPVTQSFGQMVRMWLGHVLKTAEEDLPRTPQGRHKSGERN